MTKAEYWAAEGRALRRLWQKGYAPTLVSVLRLYPDVAEAVLDGDREPFDTLLAAAGLAEQHGRIVAV